MHSISNTVFERPSLTLDIQTVKYRERLLAYALLVPVSPRRQGQGRDAGPDCEGHPLWLTKDWLSSAIARG